jgi:hypothetical protein
MNDDLPEIFEHVHPRPAPARLRREVLSVVERELSRPRKPRWEQAFELGVAASLALGIGLNAWQWRGDLGWRNQVDTPRTDIANRQELVDAVASITDKATAEMLVDRLVSMRSGPPNAKYPIADDRTGSLKN